MKEYCNKFEHERIFKNFQDLTAKSFSLGVLFGIGAGVAFFGYFMNWLVTVIATKFGQGDVNTLMDLYNYGNQLIGFGFGLMAVSVIVVILIYYHSKNKYLEGW